MYKYILQSIDNLNILALAPLVLFFVFFTVITIKTLRENKGFIEKMANLPLESDTLTNPENDVL